MVAAWNAKKITKESKLHILDFKRWQSLGYNGYAEHVHVCNTRRRIAQKLQLQNVCIDVYCILAQKNRAKQDTLHPSVCVCVTLLCVTMRHRGVGNNAGDSLSLWYSCRWQCRMWQDVRVTKSHVTELCACVSIGFCLWQPSAWQWDSVAC